MQVDGPGVWLKPGLGCLIEARPTRLHFPVSSMIFRQISDPWLSQYAYLIGCRATGESIIVDPERDVDRYLRAAREEGLRITSVVETHLHADFLSGARVFARRGGVRLYLSGEGGESWGYDWADPTAYDVHLLKDGDTFWVGQVRFDVLHTPGHTPEHLAFVVTDPGTGSAGAMGILTGDFVFVGDLGRPDLLESAVGEAGLAVASARFLYDSARRFLDLPDHWQVWPGHGSGSACGRALGAVPQSTVGYERLHNAGLQAAGIDRTAFLEAILIGQAEPPLYFGRVKRLNKRGPPFPGNLETRPLSREDFQERIADGAVVVDTRRDRSAFMRRHVWGSQLASFDRMFPTVVGSLIENPGASLVLVIDRGHAEEAVRCLARIGLDRIEGFVEPSDLDAYLSDGDVNAASIEEIGFDHVDELAQRGAVVVDVRYGWEYDQGHLPGAIHVPFTRLPECVEDLPMDRPLIVHCAGGVRSAPSAAWLSRQGWEVRYVNDVFRGHGG